MKQFYQIFIVVRIYISDDVSEMNDLWLKYIRILHGVSEVKDKSIERTGVNEIFDNL